MSYFEKLPVITYNNFQVRNITERVKLLNNPQVNPGNFYPYEVLENMRADQIAGQYYSDPTLDWLIYLVNDIIDPYYGWQLSSEEFDDYIVSKYESLELAQQTVAAFRTNWPSDDQKLTSSYYDVLPGNIKQYFEPIWGPKTILGYQRRRDDWIVSTNRIIDLSVTMNANTITNGELVEIKSGGEVIGRAECVQANSSLVTIKHVEGNTDVSSTILLRSNNQVNGSITATSVKIENIPLSEEVFWSPVYWYDIENENNSYKRFLDLLESNFAHQTSDQIRRQLNP